MRNRDLWRRAQIAVALALLLALALLTAAPIRTAWASGAQPDAYQCPTTSLNTYSWGGVEQWDYDNPVRPAWNNADKNLAMRSYSLTTGLHDFVYLGSDDPNYPPQLATIYHPDRTPILTNLYRVYEWNWATSPDPGTRGGPITTWEVTALGMETVPGELIQPPWHSYNIGPPGNQGGSVVLYADARRITLAATRADTASWGYIMHLEGLCVDPNLVAFYNSLDTTERNTYTGTPRDSLPDYDLPILRAEDVVGTAMGSQIIVMVRDSGSFLDPRSLGDWWKIRPPYATPNPSSFVDVPVSGKEWMQDWIDSFKSAGLTTGCEAGPPRYCPERSVTRAEMAVFILRALHYPNLPYKPTDTDDSFADVPTAGKAWMQPWIEEFYDLGLTTGCAATPLRFCPEREVTRAEMAVFLLRAIEGGSYQPPAASHYFADVPATGKEWMEPWIDEFYRRGITTGCWHNPLGFCPENAVTRAEMAVFILRAFDHLPSP